ncbi:leucine-rich repeat domain-containing protein, partial [Candidatus Bipolaricaulota bacterium]
SLTAYELGISNLEGIQYCTGISSLNLRTNAIPDADLSLLSGLTGLTYLNLSQNGLTNIGPLSGLSGLANLYLTENAITNVSPLSGLSSLDGVLALNNNNITNIAPLAGLTALLEGGWSLDLRFNTVTDISPLSGISGPRYLNLSGNNIADISPLSELSGVESVLLDRNSLDITCPTSPARQLIQTLLDRGISVDWEPQNTSAPDAEPPWISCPDNISTYNDHHGAYGTIVSYSVDYGDNCSGAVLSQTAGLSSGSLFPVGTTTNTFLVTDGEGLTATCSFDVTVVDTPIVPDPGLEAAIRDKIGKPTGDLTQADLEAMTGTLTAYELGISNLEGIQYCTGLTNLNLRTNSIPDADLSLLSGLTGLTYLNLSQNGLTNIGPLSGLSNLTSLYLTGNTISNVSPLSGLSSLDGVLALNNNNITNIAPLAGLTALLEGGWSLDLRFNAVNDLSPLSGIGGPRYLYLSGNNIADISPLSELSKVAVENIVLLDRNSLDITCPTGPARQLIQTLLDRGISVDWEPQDTSAPDAEPPWITCPDDVFADTDYPGASGGTVSFSVDYGDNCPGAVLSQTAGLSSGSLFPVGITTNTFLVTDWEGRTATCSFDVTVTDTGVDLSTTASPAAGGAVTGAGTYEVGTSAPISATANAGYRFDHWEGDASGSDNPTSVVMDAAKSVTAVFVMTYDLATSPDPVEGGS